MLKYVNHIPIHFIRYEDLVTNPKEILEEMFCFSMNKKSIEGLNIQRRIQAALDMGHDATKSYALKVELKDAE